LINPVDKPRGQAGSMTSLPDSGSVSGPGAS
jgi:hypothetical protein